MTYFVVFALGIILGIVALTAYILNDEWQWQKEIIASNSRNAESACIKLLDLPRELANSDLSKYRWFVESVDHSISGRIVITKRFLGV